MAPPQVPYEPLAHGHCLPAAVDWRGTAADGVVKDQAACGSCWAFGMTGAIHAAYYMATGAEGSGFRSFGMTGATLAAHYMSTGSEHVCRVSLAVPCC